MNTWITGLNYDQMLELIKANTRHYAKRQLTWFRQDQRIIWIEINQHSDRQKIAEDIVQRYKKSLAGMKN